MSLTPEERAKVAVGPYSPPWVYDATVVAIREAEREARETALAGRRMSKPPRVIGKRDERSAIFGFHEWNLESQREYDKLIKAIIRDGLEIATTEYQCHAWFPIEWTDGDGVDDTKISDPSTIYVELPLGEHDDWSPRWSFTLSDMVKYMITGHECGQGGPVHGRDPRQSFTTLSEKLRALADELDATLARPGWSE